MPMREFAPHALIADLVQSIWYIDREFAPPQTTFDILPDSRIELVFSAGVPCCVSGSDQVLAPCYLVGLLDQTIRIYAHGQVKLLGVRLYPWGVLPLLSAALSPAARGLHLPTAELAASAAAINERVLSDVDAAVAEVQRLLVDRLLRTAFDDHDFVSAARHILDQHGMLNLEALAAALYLSPRTLRRRFQQRLGIAPKSLARTARFEYVRNAIWDAPERDLAELALAAGYADQPHMAREFRAYSGRTPHRFAEEMRAARGLLRPVRNLQDGSAAFG